ncbi:MAG: preprotein translocase subunit SecE [Alicyclobacillaceae bacterium]|nr:preprotein translocase subunit SecE [Alicyclobacillaceae bacterium]
MAEPRPGGLRAAVEGIRRAARDFTGFFRDTRHEMKRIRWPGRREVVNFTAAALLTCFAMALLVWVFDLGVSKLLSLIGLV